MYDKNDATNMTCYTVPQIFMRPHEARKQADAAKLKFVLPESDHITLLNAYRAYKQSKCTRMCHIK